MIKSYSVTSFITHILGAMFFGLGVAYLFSGGAGVVVAKMNDVATDLLALSSGSRIIIYESKNNSPLENISIPPVLEYIELDKMEIPTEGKFVSANLSTMEIILYQNGQNIVSFPIETIGKKGMAWETPRGLYKIETKERTHFSTIGEVYMPFSMQFNGNYFIHGWTYYPDGTLVSADFSGGCIKLKSSSAEKIFNFVDIGTPVYVYSDTNTGEVGRFIPKTEINLSGIKASSFLVADALSGEILVSKNRSEVLPVGQLSQMVSSLVTLDAINFFNQTKVTAGQVKEFDSATLLLPGEKMVVKDLLYPMLFGDSGVAATTLAGVMGNNLFVKKMNNRAESIGLKQSVFTDPAGLVDGNLSSVTDLFKLARHTYIFKNYLWDITCEETKKVGRHNWNNQNKLTSLEGFLGGMSGQTLDGRSGAMALFSVSTTSTTSKVVIISVLDSDNAVNDLVLLADQARRSFSYKNNISQETQTSTSTEILLVSSKSSTSTTLAFVGDIMLDRGVKGSVQKRGEGDFNFVFGDIGKIKEADILFGNLEGPISDQGKNVGSIYSFRMMPQTASVLKDQGFDVLSVANNHAGDWTSKAFADTFAKFQGLDVSLVGGGLSRSEAIEPKIIMKNGIKFGYLAFSDVGPNWLRVGATTAGILLASDPEASSIIKQASTKCDVLIVSYHFGNEYENKSNWKQRELAKMAIDNGARVVVGHHPHVPQEIETYRGGVIMYSLGNFIFDQYFSTSTMSGLAVKITFDGENISQIEKYRTVLDENYSVSVE